MKFSWFLRPRQQKDYSNKGDVVRPPPRDVTCKRPVDAKPSGVTPHCSEWLEGADSILNSHFPQVLAQLVTQYGLV